ncbi:MAG: signal recognition particle [Candidatus Thermoplasmatota archaeon]|nr:signal recognition particle [Candidatus Thermoplasmatota archaeon]MCL5888987.1 signal recognition particle [Candidatus Thermoplasmatota archaeon]
MKVTLYSQYFNHKISRRLGRKVPIEVAKKFSDQKLQDILKSLNIDFEVREGYYPRVSYEKCNIYNIEGNLKKSTVIKIIERKL